MNQHITDSTFAAEVSADETKEIVADIQADEELEDQSSVNDELNSLASLRVEHDAPRLTNAAPGSDSLQFVAGNNGFILRVPASALIGPVETGYGVTVTDVGNFMQRVCDAIVVYGPDGGSLLTNLMDEAIHRVVLSQTKHGFQLGPEDGGKPDRG
jgi:hypothetical protein